MNLTRITRIVTAVIFLGVIGIALVPLANDVVKRDVLSVRIAGKFDNVSRREIEAVVREQLRSTGFFSVDVESLRRAAAALPWVRDVTVRRVWPDSVHIAVEERIAVARWNDDALMEDDAHIFKPREGTAPYSHARLSGPKGQHAHVLDRFKRLATGLGVVGGGVVGLSLSERGQWEVSFGNGMVLVPPSPLDSDAFMKFARSLPKIFGEDLQRVARIDLRYANGFAVRWREGEEVANSGDASAVSTQSKGDKG